MDDASMRVSDAEREQAVIALREHLLAGRLTLEEFSERVEGALRARAVRDLAAAQQDLPHIPLRAAAPRGRAARFTAAVFGSVTRRGRLRLRRWACAVTAFGDLDLDLREATTERPRTTVTVFGAFGNADLYLPEGVNAEVAGFTVFGRRREWGRDTAAAGAPTVRVRAIGCFFTFDLWRVPHELRGGYSEIIRALEHRQRELPA
jgi:hypothetical protein